VILALLLVVHISNLLQGLPQNFTFELMNSGTTDIRLPIPTLACGNDYRGSISIFVRFKATKPGLNQPPSGECVQDTSDYPPVLERIKTWKLLHAGERLSVSGDRSVFLYTDNLPGIYRLTATYTAPVLSANDRRQLRDAGIEFPHGKVVARRMKFVKR
jgi:hypothetical protein